MHKPPKKQHLRSSVSLEMEPSMLDGDTHSVVDTDELLALCSGKFETQEVAAARRDSGGLSKLLHSTSFTSQPAEKSTLDSTDMTEVLGLCSGAFPDTQAVGGSADPFSKFGSNVRECGDDSESEGEGGEVLSWAERQRKLTSMLALVGEEEDVIPRLARKRKRGRPQPQATRG